MWEVLSLMVKLYYDLGTLIYLGLVILNLKILTQFSLTKVVQ